MVKPQKLVLHNSYNQKVIQSGDWVKILGDSTVFLPFFQFIVSSEWLVTFYVWKHLYMKHDADTKCSKIRFYTLYKLCFIVYFRQLCFEFCVENINSYLFIYDLFHIVLAVWHTYGPMEYIYVCCMYVCMDAGAAIWVMHDFKQDDCFSQVCTQYVTQLYHLKVYRLWPPFYIIGIYHYYCRIWIKFIRNYL